MPIPREKLRLTPSEIDDLLRSERTARVGTTSSDGYPHVMPMWFVWDGAALWINSLIRSRRTRDFEHGSKAAVCIDTGIEYGELRGAVLYGVFENGESHASITDIRRSFGEKYWNGIEIPALRSHTWLRLVPERIVSWDFRKIASAGSDKRLEALEQERNPT
ncbi:MAG: pyridoxamine 5'-phosphate oxidase family protein [Actinomycetota bacterium]